MQPSSGIIQFPTSLKSPIVQDTNAREVWLIRAANRMAKDFEALGSPLPSIRVSVGWSSKGSKGKRIGEHWHPKAASDGISQIFISPILDNPIDALSTLLHELVHAVYPDDGHGKLFGKLARKLGLEGKLTATVPSPALIERLNAMIDALGQFPHSKLNPGMSSIKKQTTRMHKLECPSCGYTVRISQKWLDVGVPTCPCGEEFGGEV